MEEVQRAREEINSDKQIYDYDISTMNYIKKPVGKAIFKRSEEEKQNKKTNPRDKVRCNICSKEFTRWNRSKHNKTKHHILCEKIVSKMKNFILDDIN